jgi:hypothetical protein
MSHFENLPLAMNWLSKKRNILVELTVVLMAALRSAR